MNKQDWSNEKCVCYRVVSTVPLLWIFGTCPGTETPMNLNESFIFFFHTSLDSFSVMLMVNAQTRETGVFLIKLKCYWFAVVHDTHTS